MRDIQEVWLLLEKSDETRISKGIDGYQDTTGEEYRYDSFVPNHKNIKTGDIVILRKENEIYGYGEISEISKTPTVKTHRRCPSCNSTDIRARSTMLPKWKCGRCASEFEATITTETHVNSYSARIKGFTRFATQPTVLAVKSCAAIGEGHTSQLSMMKLDFRKIRTLLESTDIQLPTRTNKAGQGLGLSAPERKAVELHAMAAARKLYEEAGWNVVDTSSSQPFDLLAERNADKRFIEVKGTTGGGASVILTSGEVSHAKENYKESALVVVSGINLTKLGNDWIASGGDISTHLDPWSPEENRLKATQYRYCVGP
ncbi:DUF3883 domain-containing protein [Deefgea rivuli]|uniref:DUF3883 domain-containing protein n=1 Tax=Deefgea rivuli TaxID=400948 RepID=UPI000483D446|nr:DUF3883 domain-containing protein [Deefgea rivuli]